MFYVVLKFLGFEFFSAAMTARNFLPLLKTESAT